ncbi:MAG: SulP family inorganic anion transporter [Pirellulales bacterium]|nr:SulP family inorganic anion transporter [Pirellulales bacterium]
MAELNVSAQNLWRQLRGDLLPSLVVFLVALPLCMGIAIASGAPIQAGLITGIVGGIVVGSLAGSPLQVSGPAAGLSVIVLEIIQKSGLELLAFAVLAAGLVQIVAGVLGTGRWFRAVAPAVIQGMLSGIGILIFASQFHVMIDDTPPGTGLQNLLAIPQAVLKGWSLPSTTGDPAQSRLQASILSQVAKLRDEQQTLLRLVEKQVQDRLAALTSPSHTAEDPARQAEQLAELRARQESLIKPLEQIQNLAAEQKFIPQTDKTDFNTQLAAALAATHESQAALAAAQPVPEDLLRTQYAALTALRGTAASLKNHPWAGKIGVLTILIMLGWGLLKKTPLGIIPGQLISVVAAVAVAYIWQLPVQYVTIPENMLAGIRLPDWTGFTELDGYELIQATITIAIVASAETLLCATAVDQMHTGPRTNYDRELMAQGVGNTICGLLSALPMTGVIVRSAANVQAGGKTRFSAILHGVWILVFVAFLSNVLQLIPTSALAAILVYTGYKLMNFKVVKELAKFGWGEVAIYIITVLLVVFVDLLTGVLVGMGLSATKQLLKFNSFTPQYRQLDDHTAELELHGAATFLKLPQLAAILEKVPGNTTLHVDIDGLSEIDHACFELLINWHKQHVGQGGHLVLDWDRLAADFAPRAPIPNGNAS